MALLNQNLFFFALFIIVLGNLASQALPRRIDNEKISLSMRQRHEQWMAKHGRVYKDQDEKEARLRIFKENIQRIDKFSNNETSNSNNSFQLRANKFTDLSNEEFIATHTGFKQSYSSLPSNFSSNLDMANASHQNDVANSVDWRQRGAVTGIKDQQDCKCCWAFSSVAALEGIYQITKGNLISFSEKQLLDCISSYNCETGGAMTVAFQYIQQHGLETESNYPYEENKGKCNVAPSDAAVAIIGYQSLPTGDPNALMQAVSQQPVSIGIDADGFEFQNYGGGIYDQGCGTSLSHAVTVIGYGVDDMSGQQYWLIKNSWGETWGESGYMRLLMEENRCPVTLDSSYPLMS